MKLLHTADWHLGKVLYGASMLEEQRAFLNDCLFPAIEKERPDAIVIAGDIFDRSIAPPQAIRLFDEFVVRISRDFGIPLLIITGNHDGQDRIALAKELLRDKGVYIATRLEDAFAPGRLEKNGQTYHFYLLPYFEPAQLRDLLHCEDIRGFAQSYKTVTDKIRQTFKPGGVHILVSHCFVTGCRTSDSESSVYVGGSGEVSADTFAGFDYVALGHLHAPQQAGSNARYSGSPLKYSFDEAHQKKSLTLVTLEGAAVQTRQLPVCARHDVKTMKGTFEELYHAGMQAPDDSYLFATLTDDRPVYMPMDRLREYYPNLLGLKSEFLSRRAELQHGQARQPSGDAVLFTQFMEQICGQTATPEDRALFFETLKRIQEENL